MKWLVERITLRGGAFSSPTAGVSLGTAIAIPLDLIGLGGCSLYVDPFATVITGTNADGQASLAVTVPNATAMIGTALEAQWFVPDAQAPHALPLGMSDGLTIVLGI